MPVVVALGVAAVALVVTAVREAVVVKAAAVALVAPVVVVAIYLNADGWILQALTSCTTILQSRYYVHGEIDGMISLS